MGEKKEVGIILSVGKEKEYTQSFQNAVKQTKLLQAETKSLSSEFKDSENSMEYLQKRQENLTKLQDSFRQKLSAAQKGLSNARAEYKKQAEAVEALRKQLAEAKTSLTQMEQAGEQDSEAYKSQQKAVEQLNAALQKQTENMLSAQGRVTDWDRKIVEAEADIRKNSRALERNGQYLDEAKSAANGCATSIDQFGNEINEAESDPGSFEDAAQDAGDGITGFGDKLAGAVATKVVSEGFDFLKSAVSGVSEAVKESVTGISSATSQLAASTGLTEEMAARYQDVMESIRGNNFGESYEDVADVLAQIIQTMGELDDSFITSITESAITLRDTFDMQSA